MNLLFVQFGFLFWKRVLCLEFNYCVSRVECRCFICCEPIVCLYFLWVCFATSWFVQGVRAVSVCRGSLCGIILIVLGGSILCYTSYDNSLHRAEAGKQAVVFADKHFHDGLDRQYALELGDILAYFKFPVFQIAFKDAFLGASPA